MSDYDAVHRYDSPPPRPLLPDNDLRAAAPPPAASAGPVSDPRLAQLAEQLAKPDAPKPADAASPALVMRAPELTRAAIAQVFEQAAKHVEDVAEALMQQAIDAIAQAKETAAGLREKGAAEASKIEGVAKAARETVHLFKAQHAKIMGQAQ